MNTKPFYKSWTLIFNVLALIASQLDVLYHNAWLNTEHPEAIKTIALLITIVNILLRFKTSEGLTSKAINKAAPMTVLLLLALPAKSQEFKYDLVYTFANKQVTAAISTKIGSISKLFHSTISLDVDAVASYKRQVNLGWAVTYPFYVAENSNAHFGVIFSSDEETLLPKNLGIIGGISWKF